MIVRAGTACTRVGKYGKQCKSCQVFLNQKYAHFFSSCYPCRLKLSYNIFGNWKLNFENRTKSPLFLTCLDLLVCKFTKFMYAGKNKHQNMWNLPRLYVTRDSRKTAYKSVYEQWQSLKLNCYWLIHWTLSLFLFRKNCHLVYLNAAITLATPLVFIYCYQNSKIHFLCPWWAF